MSLDLCLSKPTVDKRLKLAIVTRDTYLETGDPARLSAHSLLWDGNKWMEIEYGEEKNILVLGRLQQPRQDKNLLYPTPQAQRTNRGRTNSPQFQESAGATPL